jgi:uracil phosphoribosyltransferase
VTRDLPLDPIDIETPLMPMRASVLSGKKLVFAPILRAGMGLLEGMLDLVPSARVAHIGLYRDPESLVAVEYYFKAPTNLAERVVIAVDPMLATGNTAVAAIDRLKEHGAGELRFVCLLATQTGLAKFHAHHPEVRVWTASIDPELNDHGYILPGLGDAGDRLYGTR